MKSFADWTREIAEAARGCEHDWFHFHAQDAKACLKCGVVISGLALLTHGSEEAAVKKATRWLIKEELLEIRYYAKGLMHYPDGSWRGRCKNCGGDYEVEEPEDFDPEYAYCNGGPGCQP